MREAEMADLKSELTVKAATGFAGGNIMGSLRKTSRRLKIEDTGDVEYRRAAESRRTRLWARG